MTTAATSTRWDEQLIAALAALVEREDRAALAALRRGLGKAPGEAAEVYPYVVPYLPEAAGARAEQAAYLTATLFALHPLPWRGEGDGRGPNLGAALRRLWNGEAGDSVEKRLTALLNSHRDDLPEHLRHAIALLKTNDLAVDWLRLLRDVRGWDAEARWVQRAWARAFWGAIRQNAGEERAAGADANARDA